MSWNKKYLTTSILLALSMPAMAESNNNTADATTVVSATRSEQLLTDVAASVSVISADDIEENLVKNVGEIFDYTPGITVESDPRYGIQSINIRGMEGNRVKIVIDGVSQANRFDSGQSFIQSGRLDIDPDMIKSVEVVKGPASSLYGSDAIAGIVAFETKDPSDFLDAGDNSGGHLKLGYHSVDSSFSQSVALANRTGNLESLVAYTHRAGEEEQNFGEPDPQETEKNNILVKLQYQINENNRIEFTGEQVLSDIDSDLPLDSTWDENYDAEDQHERQRIGAKYILTADNALFDSVALQLDWKKSKQISQTMRGNTANKSELKDYLYGEEGYEGSAKFDKSFALAGMEHYLTYGLSYEYRDIENINVTYKTDSAGDTTNTLYYYMPAAEEIKWGAYLQDQIVLLDGDLVLTPSVRFDSFSTNPDNSVPTDKHNNVSGYIPTDYKDYSDSAVTGKFGALYSLTEDTKVFAQVSQGFRAPDFQELFYSYSSGTMPYKSEPNPDLKAETSISYETGLRGNFSAGNYEFALFYSDYDNFIDTVTRYDDPQYSWGITSYDNLEKATVKGAELGANLWLDSLIGAFDGTTLRLAAAYTEGEDQDGLALNSVAPWNMVVGLNYDSPSTNWGTSLKTVYTAKKGVSDINSTDTGNKDQIENPSSTVVDLTAYYKPMEDLTLRAGVYNLTNEQYWSWNDVRGLIAQDNDLSQAERNYGVTVKYDF
ncbi:MAG: TonB-dependent hemoglobin/transferrin/lactoferrin family receptor [Moritella sp.]|uniref:TonB-dependent hemoglobin/transferrin/lactoferrin family receptor n=1 Tax=Moritella sp. TaxID=78556 RepID=UPI0021742DB7|nr:TonB-dependent hemoglobin/transferrin/lactoferrin family receptor [Moritella sp.]MBL1416206.1 TonB-dependent hemoglobin/transferrin/lactoferrin family receptor [Moritella sp.]